MTTQLHPWGQRSERPGAVDVTFPLKEKEGGQERQEQGEQGENERNPRRMGICGGGEGGEGG